MFTTLSAMVVAVTMTMPSVSVFGANYSEELQGAYDWAHEKWITTMSSIENANMYGNITRAEMAKMLSVYATEVLGLTADETKACTFTDIDSVKGDLHDYIIESCKLGIMGQGITAFRPYDTLSRAEFGTALSRVLWGDKYEGGTPYYAKHLDALKAAGIMNQIANAETTKEVRGYVMLMLQRSEANGAGIDCEDTDVVLACLEDLDNCPAACKAEYEDNTDEVVKSGSLVVTATANSSKSVVKSGISDMDTLKFKTSEEVTISKVVLERYGRSYSDSVLSVRLEDEDGNVITTSTENSINTKDRVSLSLKKDYKVVDGTLNAIIRIETANASGATIGFKVADVTSTAKDVDLGDYTPTEYEIVDYAAGTLTLSANNTEKKYNYTAGDSYEIAKFKMRAGSSAVKVRGFTLTNMGNLAAEDFVDNVTVTFDGKEVKNLNSSFNSDDALVISFSDQEIGINKSATVVVEATLNDDFDEYGNWIRYKVDATSDVKATESKTSAQVAVTGNGWTSWPKYTFNGSKIKLTNNKLGNVDAAQGSEGVLIADWTITLNEAINKGTVKVRPTFSTGAVRNHIDHLTLIINGDEYDSKWDGTDYYFANVEIEESGKIQVKIDITEDEGASGSVSFGSLQFTGFKYVQNKNVNADPVGSITVSKVTLQPAKATMENNLTKSVQYVTEDSARKLVFEGTYTAKKGDIYLNKFTIATSATWDQLDIVEGLSGYNYDRTFYLFVDGQEVGEYDDVVLTGLTTSTVKDTTPAEDFDEVLVEKGKSVTIKVEAEIDATNEGSYDYSLFVWWKDDNDNTPSGIASDEMVTINLVNKGSVTIPTSSSSKNTVLLKAKNATLATFTVKPSNNNEGLTLENIIFTGTIGGGAMKWDKIKVKVAGTEYDVEDETATDMEYVINEDLPTDGLTVEVILKNEATGSVELTVKNVNDATSFTTKTFTTKYASALVYIASQKDDWGVTTYTLGVDKYDDDYQISNVALGTWTAASACTGLLTINGGTPDENGDSFEIVNTDAVQMITCISYTVAGWDLTANENVVISTDDSSDYFKVNGASWRVFKND